MAENIKELEKMADEVFKTTPITFKYDFEDYENCKLNTAVKKMITEMKITIPIIHMKGGCRYFIGIKHVNLELHGDSILVK